MQRSLVRPDIFLSPTSTCLSVLRAFFLQLPSKVHKTQMNSSFIHVSPGVECTTPDELCVLFVEGFLSKFLHDDTCITFLLFHALHIFIQMLLTVCDLQCMLSAILNILLTSITLTTSKTS